MTEHKGAVRKALGWLTADRGVEAEGKAAEETGESPPSEADVAAAEQEVKAEHFDYGTEGHPAPTTDR